MREEPLVSIALCTYNGGRFLSQQLDSILGQTYHNLEIVIVDDCSTDDTSDIITRYIQKDSRIKFFKNEVNLGFNKNFEKAIELTTGEYISISDQDDIWLPNKIEALVKDIADNWLVYSKSEFINEKNEVLPGQMLNESGVVPLNYKGILLANFVTGHTVLFKRNFIDYFLPFPEKGFYDWWMGFIALYHHKAVFLNQVLTQYRIHEASVIQKRANSGQEQKDEVTSVSNMLTAFASYKNLEEADAVFIARLNEAWKQNISKENPLPLIRLIANNYNELFVNHKSRKGFSRINFAFKYARNTRKYAR
ncbi:MAG: glycosyltransferase [Bacteroidetes bacterium]|jgi:glycosyltransferase involved in cell wall biosynthesis|nr:glycosyltransferase [Bacteroidota bacterium]